MDWLYLQWRFRTHGHAQPPQPVLRDFKNIECRDAVLSWSQIVPCWTPAVSPCSPLGWQNLENHPVTGERVPDDSARLPCIAISTSPGRLAAGGFHHWQSAIYWRRPNARALGDGYVEALRSAYPDVPDSADLVMFWWCRQRRARRP